MKKAASILTLVVLFSVVSMSGCKKPAVESQEGTVAEESKANVEEETQSPATEAAEEGEENSGN